MALDRLKENETEANRVRKLNAIVDALNRLGLDDGIINASALPLATATTAGVVIIGTGLTVIDGTVTAP